MTDTQNQVRVRFYPFRPDGCPASRFGRTL